MKLISKTDKKVLRELDNSANSLLAYYQIDSINEGILKNRLQRLETAKTNFQTQFEVV